MQNKILLQGNVLDDKNRSKITYFRFSCYILHSQLLKSTFGSPCYVTSPACIAGKAYGVFKNNIRVLGIIFFATVTSQLPGTKKIESELLELM